MTFDKTIGNKFKIVTVGEDDGVHVAGMHCTCCDKPFEAHIDILKPKNCNFILGEKVVFTCPHCQETVSLTQEACVAERLRAARYMLEEHIATYEKTHAHNIEVSADPFQPTMSLRCKACNKVTLIAGPDDVMPHILENDVGGITLHCADASCACEDVFTFDGMLDYMKYIKARSLLIAARADTESDTK